MSLFRRIKRYFLIQNRPELAMADRVGIGGEQYAEQFLTSPLVVSRIANPVLPHPNASHVFLESDFLVYAAGTLFCLEVKNYKGAIYYAEGDPTQIVQQKLGRYGEQIPAKWHRSPVHQAKGFIFHLKQYLAAHVDPRFAGLYIVPVAAFVRNKGTDISQIWNPAQGIVYVDELPNLLQAKGNPRFAARPSKWVVEGMRNVPRPDVLITAAGDVLRGFLTHSHLTFKVNSGQPVMIPFSEISQVRLNRSGRFSDSDVLDIVLRNAQQQRYLSIEGTVHLRTLHGAIISKHLQNLVLITTGRRTGL